jgi:hypothetical protein
MKTKEKKSHSKWTFKKPEAKALTDEEMYELEKSINEDIGIFRLQVAESERQSWLEISKFKAG